MARGQVPAFGPQGPIGNIQLQTNIGGGYLNPGRPNVENVGKGLMQLADAGFKMGKALSDADIRASKLRDKAALIDAETLWSEFSLMKEMDYKNSVRGFGASKNWAQGSINTNKDQLAMFLDGNVNLKAPPGTDQAAWTQRLNDLNGALKTLRPESKVALQQFIGQQTTAWGANVTRYQISQAEAALQQQLKIKSDQAALRLKMAPPSEFGSAMWTYLDTINAVNQADGVVGSASGGGTIKSASGVSSSGASAGGDASTRGIITDTSPKNLFSAPNMVKVTGLYIEEFQNKINALLHNNDFAGAREFLNTYGSYSLSNSHPEESKVTVPLYIQEFVEAKLIDAEKAGYFESVAQQQFSQFTGPTAEEDALASAQLSLGDTLLIDDGNGKWVEQTVSASGRAPTRMTQADIDNIKTRIKQKYAARKREDAAVQTDELNSLLDNYENITRTHMQSSAGGAAQYPRPEAYPAYDKLDQNNQMVAQKHWQMLNSGEMGAKGPTVMNSAALATSWGVLPIQAKSAVSAGTMMDLINNNIPASMPNQRAAYWRQWGEVQVTAPALLAEAQLKAALGKEKVQLDIFSETISSASAHFTNKKEAAVEAIRSSYLDAMGSGEHATKRSNMAVSLFSALVDSEYAERVARGPSGSLTMDNADVDALIAAARRKFDTSLTADQGGVFGLFQDFGSLGEGQYGISQLVAPIDDQGVVSMTAEDRKTIKAAQITAFGDWRGPGSYGVQAVTPPSSYFEVASLYAQTAQTTGVTTQKASIEGLQLFTNNMHSWVETQVANNSPIATYFERAQPGSFNNQPDHVKRKYIYKVINATVAPTSAERTRYVAPTGQMLSANVVGQQAMPISTLSRYGPSLLAPTQSGVQSAQQYIFNAAKGWVAQ
jgi:hypothetical protein